MYRVREESVIRQWRMSNSLLLGAKRADRPISVLKKVATRATFSVPRTGVEPVIFGMRTRCPRPLDERGVSLTILPIKPN